MTYELQLGKDHRFHRKSSRLTAPLISFPYCPILFTRKHVQGGRSSPNPV